MPVLIDGFNLLHAARASIRASIYLGRAQLSRMLGAWSAVTREKVTVVLDGAAPPRDLAGQLGDPRIATIYAGAKSADARIAELLAESSAARRIRVVSSDREVQREAQRAGAAYTRSEDFFDAMYRELKHAAQGGAADPEDEKRGEEPIGVNAWLESFGFDPGETPFEHP